MPASTPSEVDGLARTRSRPPRKSRSPATSGSATSRSSARSATAAAPAAASSVTRRWRWRPASATSRSRGAVAKRGAAASRPWSQVADRVRGQHQWTAPVRAAASGRRDRHARPPLLPRVRRHARAARRRSRSPSRQHANRNPGAMMHDEAAHASSSTSTRGGSPSRCACSTTASSPTAPARS